MSEFKKGTQGDIYNNNIYIGSEKYENKVVTKKDLDDLFSHIHDRYEIYNLSTGLISFEGITLLGDWTIKIGRAQGYIVNNLPVNPAVPNSSFPYLSNSITFVQYPGLESYTVTPGIYKWTFFWLHADQKLYITHTYPDAKEQREWILLGHVQHPTNKISAVLNEVNYIQSPAQQVRDLWDLFGLFNNGIHPYAPALNPSSMKFGLSAGELWGNGINFGKIDKNPNRLVYSGIIPNNLIFTYRTSLGVNQPDWPVGEGNLNNQTDVKPAKYENVSNPSSPTWENVTGYSNQRVFLAASGNIVVQYGQKNYGQLSEALAAINTESFITYEALVEDTVLIGIITLKSNCDNLGDSSKAVFTTVSGFGSTSGTSGSIVVSLQTAYDNSAPPQIITSYNRGALKIKQGSVAENNVLEIIDSSGNPAVQLNADKSIQLGTEWEIKNNATNLEINEIGVQTPNIMKIYKTPADPGSLGKAVKVNIDATTTIKELEFGGW